jgi:cell surface protein SprA
MFKNIFQSFKISHGYQSRLRVNTYQSNLEYVRGEQTYTGGEAFNYYSRFNSPALSIEEAFSPLIGIDMRFKNTMSIKFESKKSRTLNLTLDSRQLNETRAEDWTLGFGYTLNGVEFDFLSKKKKKKPAPAEEENNKKKKGIINGRGGAGAGEAGDLTLNFDFSLRDDITDTYLIDRDQDGQTTRGNTRVSINPSAEYRLNKQLSLRLFVDYTRTTPKTSNSFPQTNFSSGVTVRFELQ